MAHFSTFFLPGGGSSLNIIIWPLFSPESPEDTNLANALSYSTIRNKGNHSEQ